MACIDGRVRHTRLPSTHQHSDRGQTPMPTPHTPPDGTVGRLADASLRALAAGTEIVSPAVRATMRMRLEDILKHPPWALVHEPGAMAGVAVWGG